MGRQDYEQLLAMLGEPYGWERMKDWLMNENEHSLSWFLEEFQKHLMRSVALCAECTSITQDVVDGHCEACRREMIVDALYPKATP